MRDLFFSKSFRKTLQGYLLVLLLPVLAGLLLSGLFASSISQSQAEIIDFYAERFGRAANSLLGEAAFRCRSIAADENLKLAMAAGPEETVSADQRYYFNNTYSLLADDSFFSDSYVYFRRNDSLLCRNSNLSFCGRMTSPWVDAQFPVRFGAEKEELWDAAVSAGMGGRAILREIDGRMRLLFLLPVPPADSYRYAGLIIGVVREDVISEVLADYPPSGRLYLIDEGAEGGRMIYGDAAGLHAEAYEGTADPAFFFGHLHGRTVNAIEPTGRGGLICATVLRSGDYYRPVYLALLGILAYALVCLAVGGLLVLRLSQRDAAAMDRFLHLTSADTPEEAAMAIEENLKRTAGHRRELETVEHDLTRERLLLEMIMLEKPDFSIARLALNGIVLDREKLAVGLFVCDDYNALFFGENKDMNEYEREDTACLILRSVAEELCGKVARAYVVRSYDDPLALFCFDCPEQELLAAMESTAAFIRENFGLEFKARLGRTISHSGSLLTSLQDAYRRHTETLDREVREDGPVSGIAAKLRDYIGAHYTDQQLSIGMIADALGVSVSHISHVMKAQMGVTVLEYINIVRLKAARELLVTTRQSVGAVAAAVGYSGADSFTRAMRKYEGMTPGEYRKQQKG